MANEKSQGGPRHISHQHLDRRKLVRRGVGLGAFAATASTLLTSERAFGQEGTPVVTPQPTVQPAGNAVRLEYWDMAWGSEKFMAQLQDNVTEFNRTHPEIHVSFTQLNWGDYTQKLLSAVQAGNPPDIGGGDSGIPFNMAAQGEALDISDLFQ